MSIGLVVDVDGAAGFNALRHPWHALRRRTGPARDERSLMGIGAVARRFARVSPGTPVVYLTSAPPLLVPFIRRALATDGFPPGALEAPGSLRNAWGAGGARHKREVLDALLERTEPRRWFLLGDDGEDDTELFAGAAERGGVAAIALRHVEWPDADLIARMRERVGPVPLLTAATGQELVAGLTDVLGIGPRGIDDWFLTDEERGNTATDLRAWTEGNAARALIHGLEYLSSLGSALRSAGNGDHVLLGGWRADAEQMLDDTPAGEELAAAAGRGALVRALVWRSHSPLIGYASAQNRRFAGAVGRGGGRVLLDHRVRPFGSHHQKFAVIRQRDAPADGASAEDVGFVGGLDVAASRRDDETHRGDRLTRSFASVYGPTPAWHDVQVELRGPVLRDLEEVFRERWTDPSPLVRAPWRIVRDAWAGMSRRADPLPDAHPDPPEAGTSAVQLLRTYPRRTPAHPFAPTGERSVARAYAKALNRAQRLVYVEDQYLWSVDVARVFATALHRAPDLQLIVVVPRFPDQESPIKLPAAGFGQGAAMELVRRAGGDRVQVLDPEREDGTPIYTHGKLCIVDDVWAAVGSANLNRRSWTHDSELVAAVLDAERDPRSPADPGGLGDGARRFARDLRLSLMREHLGRVPGDDGDLLDPDGAARAVRQSAAAVEAWHEAGRRGPRPAGRLRPHPSVPPPRGLSRALISAFYGAVFDPDGRPLGMRLRRTF